MPGRAFRQSLRRICIFDLSNHERVKPNHLLLDEGNICGRGIRLLTLQGMADQEAVEVNLSAIEGLDVVTAVQLFNKRQVTPSRAQTR